MPNITHRAQAESAMAKTRAHILETSNRTRKLCYRKDDRAMRAILVDREPLRRYGHLKFFQDGGGRHLGFDRTDTIRYDRRD